MRNNAEMIQPSVRNLESFDPDLVSLSLRRLLAWYHRVLFVYAFPYTTLQPQFSA